MCMCTLECEEVPEAAEMSIHILRNIEVSLVPAVQGGREALDCDPLVGCGAIGRRSPVMPSGTRHTAPTEYRICSTHRITDITETSEYQNNSIDVIYIELTNNGSVHVTASE